MNKALFSPDEKKKYVKTNTKTTKEDVSNLKEYLTSERTSNLDSLDVPVSSRATQESLDMLQTTATNINTKTDEINTKLGTSGDISGSNETTLFSLIKHLVSMFTSYFTSDRAGKLDNLDVSVSTRATQTSINEVKTEVEAINQLWQD